MNDHSTPALLKISTVNLSVDGAHITPNEGQVNIAVSEPAALAALQSFAALSALQLAGVEAKIYLAGPRGKLAVQNERGKLFATFVPEATNTAAELTPEQIIAELTALNPAATSAAAQVATAQEAALIAEGKRHPGGWRRLKSGWTAAALAVVTATLAYVSFAPETPDGVAIIRDPAKISRLHSQFNGSYGVPNATNLVLAGGHLTGRESPATGGSGATLFEKDYQFGLSDSRVVLVVENGALLEPQPDGSLKFLDSTYPRLNRP